MLYEPQTLLTAAAAAQKKAYTPYSQFKVGAALLTNKGRIYSGCNVENCSYGLSICAERVALFRAVAAGERKFVAIAIIGGSLEACFPCGACRQVLAEFAPDLEIITGQPGGTIYCRNLKDLLPDSFC